MVGVRLDNAVLDYCKMKEVDLREASLKDVRAQFTEFKETNLEKIKAQNANFVEANFDELCNLSEAELQNAIMQRIKLNGVNLAKANMQFADLTGAEMERAIIENAEMQYANLTASIANGLQASGANMTGAILNGIEASKANFKGAILQDVKAQQAKLDEAILEEANLIGADFTKAILEKAKLNNALVNLHTLFKDANIEGIEGDNLLECVINEDGTITKTKVNITELQRKTELAEDAASRGFLRKGLGSLIQGSGSMIESVGGFVKQPFSNRIGLKTGAVIGLVLAICIVVSVAMPLLPGAWLATPFLTTATAVASLIPGMTAFTTSVTIAAIPMKMLAVAISTASPTLFTTLGVSATSGAVTVFATAAAGLVTTIGVVGSCALIGRYVVKHVKCSHVAAATAGFTAGLAYGIILGPLAPVVGVASAVAAVISTVITNTVFEKATGVQGMTIDGLVAAGIAKGGNITKVFGGYVGITPEQTTLLKEWKAYEPQTREGFKESLAKAKLASEPVVEKVTVVQKPEQPQAKQNKVIDELGKLFKTKPKSKESEKPEKEAKKPTSKSKTKDEISTPTVQEQAYKLDKKDAPKFTEIVPPPGRRASMSEISDKKLSEGYAAKVDRKLTTEKHVDKVPPKRRASMSDISKTPAEGHTVKVGTLEDRSKLNQVGSKKK